MRSVQTLISLDREEHGQVEREEGEEGGREKGMEWQVLPVDGQEWIVGRGAAYEMSLTCLQERKRSKTKEVTRAYEEGLLRVSEGILARILPGVRVPCCVCRRDVSAALIYRALQEHIDTSPVRTVRNALVALNAENSEAECAVCVSRRNLLFGPPHSSFGGASSSSSSSSSPSSLSSSLSSPSSPPGAEAPP